MHTLVVTSTLAVARVYTCNSTCNGTGMTTSIDWGQPDAYNSNGTLH